MRFTLDDLRASGLLRDANFVGGAWVEVDQSNAIAVHDPADGTLIGYVPKLGRIEVDCAIDAAQVAQKEWAVRTARDRATVLRNWFDLMIEHRDELAQILTMEQGKPLAEAAGEITYGASFVEWFAEEARRVYGETIPGHQPDKRILVTKQPIGVVAAITPWNFPNAMIARKAAPAFAAGCAMILKPASQTPYSAIALAVLGERAGLPPGLFSVITGAASEIGAELTESPVIRKLTFTGSTEIGAKLYAQSAPTIKKLGLELGGNAPFIVFDDADLDAAVEGAMIAKFRNNGQTCVCANRIYVQEGVYDAFAEKLAKAVSDLRTGNGMESGVDLGPLIDENAFEKVQSHVSDVVEKGGRVLAGGKPHALGGTFYEPTVLADVTSEMAVAREETFGPVAPLFRFTDEAEAIQAANDTEFGLASYFYAQDVARIFRVSEGLEYGMVGVNTGLISTAEAPFGGVKMSGLGREGSRHGMEDYLELKYICLGGVA
ncbi:NAD-dependent succinate-semialdehyde dehydrogenase [Celeribacter halophilus]|uniref:NAD-dependent succinate-semialdehyde dehydrogenase n=1 Tax=Celeribacter halophilus TaxID=576117 RepID=UPI002FD63B14